MRIKVTAGDIAAGIRDSTVSCPIALAVKRRLRPSVYLDVQHCELSLSWGSVLSASRREESKLPPEAMDFISRFDRREGVVPFAFDVRIPPWAASVDQTGETEA